MGPRRHIPTYPPTVRCTLHRHIHTLDVVIESVSRSAPALAPLFRSEQQLQILAVLFAGAELAIGGLAQKAGVAQATASRR